MIKLDKIVFLKLKSYALNNNPDIEWEYVPEEHDIIIDYNPNLDRSLFTLLVDELGRVLCESVMDSRSGTINIKHGPSNELIEAYIKLNCPEGVVMRHSIHFKCK